MNWVETQLGDEALFPTEAARPWPKHFKDVVRKICARLFRVYGHIYHSHFAAIVQLGAEAHLNTCFKRFALFLLTFDLIDKKELAPLEDLIDSLTGGALTTAGGVGAK